LAELTQLLPKDGRNQVVATRVTVMVVEWQERRYFEFRELQQVAADG
jgi:hypothetical protein